MPLLQFVNSNNFSITCLSETKLHNTSLPLLPNLHIYRNDRTDKGGGIAIILNSNIKSHKISLPQNIFPFQNYECLTINVQLDLYKSFFICLIYRPIFTLNNEDIDFYERLIQYFLETKKDFYICGDMNIHMESESDPSVKKFKSMLQRQNTFVLTTKPTRNSAMLDFFLSNDNSKIIEENVIDPHLSDHLCCYIVRNCKVPKPQKKLIYRRNFNQMNLEKLAETAITTVFDKENDLNENFLNFTDKIIKMYDEVAPIKPMLSKQKTFTLSAQTKAQMRIRNKTLDQLKKRGPKYKEQYQKEKKLTKMMINQDSKQFIKHSINTNGLWQTLDRLKNKEPIKTDDYTPDALNEYFNSITNPVDPPKQQQNLLHVLSDKPTFQFRKITSAELLTAWKMIKKKNNPKPDCLGLSYIMLQYTISCPNVYEHLVHLINRCLTEGVFPDCLKISNVHPIPKKENPVCESEFRPISVQPTLSKLLERCMYSQLIEYIQKENILDKHQFGFRANHTCEHAMLALSDKINTALEVGEIALVTSLDLRKAFDTVNPNILMDKLNKLGIDNKIFYSYFENRKQRVELNGCFSSLLINTIGIPQGTILGPILFSLYINDLPSCIKYSTCSLFADDNNLIHTGNIEDTKKLITEIEEDLHLVDSWMKRNDMKLNKNKTKLCVFGSKLKLRKLNESMDEISIQFNDVTVSPDDTILCLGLTLDKHMTWKTHVNLLCKKLNFALNSTRALQPYLDSHELYILLSSYLLSQITYMICLWGQAPNKTLKLVEKCMRRGARIILSKTKKDKIKHDITSKLLWLLPKNLYMYKLCIFYHTIVNYPSKIPYFKSMLSTYNYNYNTRCVNQYYITTPVLNEYGKNRLINLANDIWRSLPNDMRLNLNQLHFKILCKQYFLDLQLQE